MSVDVEVLFFAKSREIVGQKSSTLCLPTNITYKDLAKKIVDVFHLEIIEKNIIIAVNEEFCVEEANIDLKPGDRIAVIPPLSGG